MRVRVFQPFQKVWTPRTPDSAYDSLGVTPPPDSIVIVPMIGPPNPPSQWQCYDQIGATLTLLGGTYSAATAITGAIEPLHFSTKFLSGTYTA